MKCEGKKTPSCQINGRREVGEGRNSGDLSRFTSGSPVEWKQKFRLLAEGGRKPPH